MSERESLNAPELYKEDLERHLFEFERSSDVEPPDQASLAEKLAEAVERLPKLYREVVILQAKEGLRYAEIAERLSVPLGTVKSRLYRARTALRRILDELHGNGEETAPDGLAADE